MCHKARQVLFQHVAAFLYNKVGQVVLQIPVGITKILSLQSGAAITEHLLQNRAEQVEETIPRWCFLY